MKHPVGVIDSGVGGLSVWQKLIKYIPHESIIYAADHAALPYSTRSTRFIRNRIVEIISWLVKRRIKLVIIACNTATVAGIDYYRGRFPGLPIVGIVPVIKVAAQKSKSGYFAVLSTSYTANSDYQKELIRQFAPDHRVINIGCRNLVRHVEAGKLSDAAVLTELKNLLVPIRKNPVDVLALGCTHYPFLKQAISQVIGNRIEVLDSAAAVGRHAYRVLKSNRMLSRSKDRQFSFYTSGSPDTVSDTARKLLHRPIRFRQGDW